MGFSSGTQIFDNVVGKVLKLKTISDEDKQVVITALAEALEDADWDTQNDSEYWDNPIVYDVMSELGLTDDEDDE